MIDRSDGMLRKICYFASNFHDFSRGGNVCRNFALPSNTNYVERNLNASEFHSYLESRFSKKFSSNISSKSLGNKWDRDFFFIVAT